MLRQAADHGQSTEYKKFTNQNKVTELERNKIIAARTLSLSLPTHSHVSALVRSDARTPFVEAQHEGVNHGLVDVVRHETESCFELRDCCWKLLRHLSVDKAP